MSAHEPYRPDADDRPAEGETPGEPGRDNRTSDAEASPRGSSAWPLEPSPESFREMLREVGEHLARHLGTLAEQPASYAGREAELEAAVASLGEELPEEGAALPSLLEHLFEQRVPWSFNSAAGGYLAYVPGGGLPVSGLADLIASVINRYVGVWNAAPALVELETDVLRWFSRLVGYPATAGGYLASGGSLANFTALVTARRERLPENFLNGVLYTSEQVHHSVAKAALLAGFPPSSVRAVAVDERFRLRLDALAEAVAEDRRRGLRPFLVTASAGTTNTGAVDDLEGVADLALREGLWMHVDAAYGGFFVMTERGRRAMSGLSRADSITLDPHKGLFLPYGTGSLLVRDGESLRRAHSVHAEYLNHLRPQPGRVDFCEVSPELSRSFRGLGVWLPMKLHGAVAFRRALDEKLDLAAWAADELRRMEDVEIVAEPQLSITAFRLRPSLFQAAPEAAPGTATAGATDPMDDAARLDSLNHAWMEAVNRRRRVFLSGTKLRGAFALRLCVLSFRTHREQMEAALEDLRAARDEVLAAAGL